MTNHITPFQMERFCAKTLEIPEMTWMAEHMGDCQACQQLFHEVFGRRRNYAPVVFNLSHDWLKDEHLEYEQLVPYVEERMDEEEREMAEIHLRMCGRCRESVRDFREFRRQIEPELSVRYGPREPSTLRDKILSWWNAPKGNWKLVYAAAVMLIIAGAVVLAAILIQGHRTNHQRAAGEFPPPQPLVTHPAISGNSSEAPQQREGDHENARPPEHQPLNREVAKINPSRSMTSQPRAIRDNSKTDRSAVPADRAVSLKDSSGEIILDRAGHVTGLSNVPTESQLAVREALLARGVKRPQVLNSLYGEGGAMRGAKETGAPFKLLTPERTVVAEDRPLFKWQQLAGATGYQVHVVDPSNREVDRSAILSPPTLEWRPITPLKRGVVYTWVVTAMVNGEEVMSPNASAPEMRFKVLEGEKVTELNRLRNSNSHVVLGVFYARAGMITDAEREFQLLVKENPKSRIALSLLRSVQSW